MTEHLDVVVVGAGLSGIGAGYHLQTECPGRPTRSSRPATAWAAPGTSSATRACAPTRTCSRSASRSSRGAARPSPTARRSSTTSSAPRGSTTSTSGSATARAWSAPTGRAPTLAGPSRSRSPAADGSVRQESLTCGFFYSCAGYYDYEHPHDPLLPGIEDFAGTVVHPQFWPEDLDVTGKRVVVIGSGATAVTLVPALGETAGSVTMLQRTPTWITAVPARDKIADRIRAVLPAQAGPPDDPDEEHRLRPGVLRALPASARLGPQAPPRTDGQDARRRRGGGARALHPAVRPVGPAPLPGPRRGLLPGDAPGQGRGGHRHHRHVRPRGDPPGVGQGPRGRRRRHRHRPAAAALRRRESRRSTAPRSRSTTSSSGGARC